MKKKKLHMVMDSLLKVSLLELKVEDVTRKDCQPVCDKMYEIAGKDGHEITTSHFSFCVCAPPSQKYKSEESISNKSESRD